MIADYLRLNMSIEDEEFDRILYPENIIKMSRRHFTEIEVAIKASQLLVTKPKQTILDIGCGVGKFCFVASSYTQANYVGIDYRKHFIDICHKITLKHHFKNVDFIHEDILNVDFTKYDSFYFYNSFLEHTDATAILDDTINVQQEKYKIYFDFLREQFEKLPIGTRIVTYHAEIGQIPDSYKIISSHFWGLLKCWEKTEQ